MIGIRSVADGDVDRCAAFGLDALRPVFASFEDCYGPDLFGRMYPEWETAQESHIRSSCTDADTRIAVLDTEVAGLVATTIDKETGLGDIGAIVVSSDHQRRGIGRMLVTDALDRMREAGMKYATAYTRDHPGHLPVRELLQQAGFETIGVQPRTLVTQLQSGEANHLPGNVRIGTDRDVSACVAFGIEAFRPVFASFEKNYGTDLFNRMRPDWENAQMAYIQSVCTDKETLVATVDGNVAGFAVLDTDVFDGIGAIELLAVDPNHNNRGLGTLLNHAALNHLSSQGMAYAVVSTGSDPSHAPARRSYEKVGFRLAPVQWHLMAVRLL